MKCVKSSVEKQPQIIQSKMFSLSVHFGEDRLPESYFLGSCGVMTVYPPVKINQTLVQFVLFLLWPYVSDLEPGLCVEPLSTWHLKSSRAKAMAEQLTGGLWASLFLKCLLGKSPFSATHFYYTEHKGVPSSIRVVEEELQLQGA